MICTSCLRAQQVAHHKDYQDGCLGCGVRRLAHMAPEERARQLDRIQFVSGWDMRCEAVRLVREEVARIMNLLKPLPTELRCGAKERA